MKNDLRFAPVRDTVENYIGGQSPLSLDTYAAIKLGILHDMGIKLTYAQKEHLFSLPTEIAMDSYVRSIIMKCL